MTTTVRLGAVFAVLLLCNTALGVAPLEQLLEQAMHANPDIVAARAQVELANAELNRAQLKVAREVVALRSRLIALGEEIKHMEIQIRRPPGEKYQNLLTARIDTEGIQGVGRVGNDLSTPQRIRCEGKRRWRGRLAERNPFSHRSSSLVMWLASTAGPGRTGVS